MQGGRRALGRDIQKAPSTLPTCVLDNMFVQNLLRSVLPAAFLYVMSHAVAYESVRILCWTGLVSSTVLLPEIQSTLGSPTLKHIMMEIVNAC